MGEAIKKTGDVNVKALLQFIESDEMKHHKALESLIERIQTPEEISFKEEMADLARVFK